MAAHEADVMFETVLADVFEQALQIFDANVGKAAFGRQGFGLQLAFADVSAQLAGDIVGSQADEGEIAWCGLPFDGTKTVFLA